MMDRTSARERNGEHVLSERAPVGWANVQDSVATATGLSILLVEGHQPPSLAVSNNNSICHAFQSSKAHAHLCDPFCGEAHNRAQAGGSVETYRCHAGLHCIAMPVELERNRKLSVIGGRAFLTTADYRALAERFRVGDLQDALNGDVFKNVIFAARQDLNDLSLQLTRAATEYSARPDVKEEHVPAGKAATARLEKGESVEMPGPLGMKSINSMAEATEELKALAVTYHLASLALLWRTNRHYEMAFVHGKFTKQPVGIFIEATDEQLFMTFEQHTSLPVWENQGVLSAAKPAGGAKTRQSRKALELFPLCVGRDVKGALLVADSTLNEDEQRAISIVCRQITLPLEIFRLRAELDKRARFADSLQNFSNRIHTVEPSEVYVSILRHSAEMLHSERSSLLLFDEAANELAVKAALGSHTDVLNERIRVGEGISGSVLMSGRPLVVHDLEAAGQSPSPADRHYKTKSFISFPLAIGGKKVGVLNITDKAGGGPYDEGDLRLLESIAPQMTLALDRAEWQEKAAQFQLMSITDPLTGLLNRRYLEERLTEELSRSQRHNFAMSFMMIDIDDFKFYNDQNGHPAGDLALEMTAQCLKSALRAADIASRYGGEEFCILLPQTTLEEAIQIASRIRRRVERTRFPHGKTQPLGMVTISIGVSTYSEILDSCAAIIGAADRALYLAKRLGKNRVQVLDDAPTGSPIPDGNEDPT